MNVLQLQLLRSRLRQSSSPVLFSIFFLLYYFYTIFRLSFSYKKCWSVSVWANEDDLIIYFFNEIKKLSKIKKWFGKKFSICYRVPNLILFSEKSARSKTNLASMNCEIVKKDILKHHPSALIKLFSCAVSRRRRGNIRTGANIVMTSFVKPARYQWLLSFLFFDDIFPVFIFQFN